MRGSMRRVVGNRTHLAVLTQKGWTHQTLNRGSSEIGGLGGSGPKRGFALEPELPSQCGLSLPHTPIGGIEIR
jgi:hypothetical protein